MESNAEECFNRLVEELLGPDYTIVDPVGGNQSREIMTEDIIRIYKKKPTLKERIKQVVADW